MKSDSFLQQNRSCLSLNFILLVKDISKMILAPSYNQPKLSPNASWNLNATTIANSGTIGLKPRGIFIDINDTIYIADRANNRIQIWFNSSSLPTNTISGNLSIPNFVFVIITGDMYFNSNTSIDKWSLDRNMSTGAIYINSMCFGLFVDISNTIYCSMLSLHQVVKQWLKDNSTTWTIVAGNGTAGNSSKMLQSPFQIFVDTYFDLYVADAENHRIQLFRQGQSDGITVAGNESTNLTTTLYFPTAVVLDADKYLFITDCWNNRIIGSGPYGFRCIAGCSRLNGSTPSQFSSPISLNFDSHGNLYVLDFNNHRLQKLSLIEDTSGKCNQRTLHRLLILCQI